MNKTQKLEKYDDKQIFTIKEDYKRVRARPTMFIQAIELEGVRRLFLEIIGNSIDEKVAGFCTTIDVCIIIKNRTPIFKVKDNGRGIPLGKLRSATGKLFTSGKYGDLQFESYNKGVINSGAAYGISIGTFGIGCKAVTALSEYCKITSIRDGESHTITYSKGIETSYTIKKVDTSNNTGTYVEFIPDIEILKKIDISNQKKTYYDLLDIFAYTTAGITINFKWNDDKPVKFYHPNGIQDYFNKIVYDKKIKLLGKSHSFSVRPNNEIGFNIIYGFHSGSSPIVVSYVNGIYTSEGGVHVKTFSEALGILTSQLNKNGYIPKSVANNVKITGREVNDCLIAIILAEKTAPRFDSQTKNNFTSEDYKPLLINGVKDQITHWINKNPDTINKIGEHVALLARVRYENSKNKEKTLKSGSSKTDLFKNIDVKKFSDCNKNDPDKCEIFLCEGDSAASSVKAGRNRDYQAVFALRGKVKNVIKSDDLSEELVTLIKILGIGFGNNINIKKLRYKRIIILTDADDDGMHISSLLIAFFHRYYPELIENGNIFIAKPPLYTLKSKNNTLFISNQNQLNQVLSEKSIRVFDVIDPDENKIPIGVAKYYLQSLPDFSVMLERFSQRLSIDPLLLEAIAMDFGNVMKGNFKNVKKYGFELYDFKILPNGIRLATLDKGYEHFYLKIDKTFIDKIIKPIINYIKNNIKLCRLRLLGKGTGLKYSGFYYEQGKLVYNSLFGSSSQMVVKRSKGLGSMNDSELRITAMDPDTRNVIQLKASDYDLTTTWIERLFTNSLEKKLMFSTSIEEQTDIDVS